MSSVKLFDFLRIGVYRHYKGNVYRVTGAVTHSETLEPMVLYRDVNTNKQWARPYSMFFENVNIDGQTQPRFKLQDVEGVVRVYV